MKTSELFTTLLTADIKYEKYSRNYRRLVLLNVLLYIATTMSGIFLFINIFKLEDYLVAGMDLIVCLSLAYAIYDVHKNKRLPRAINLFVFILFAFLLSFSLVNQNESNGLVWTIFFPLVSILLMNKNQALPIVSFFYILLFFFAFDGVGTWQNGDWNVVSSLRLMASSITLTYIVYFMEYSHEISENKLELIRLKEKETMKVLAELSIRDSLTKLYNRRHLDTIFKKEFQTAKRHDYYFCFFILDIDYFKQYNDTYGHKMGDDALCTLSEAMNAFMRRSEDFVFRLGGEEFCGICVNKDESKIQAQLKVLLHAIQSLEIEHKSSLVSSVLTVSMGVKITKDYEKYDFDTLYKEADDALYKAKNEGRNRLIFS
ncbi:GGDEF domain-containing protein [Sulfurimonas sp. MAG313]|nr:diguanylate cyclase [Sulfurimonas sp. MAG313]MDF1880964.1 GGDEF domain-containing protein [Sulfurimonas sp. MAG313]